MKEFMTNFKQIKLFEPYLQSLSIVIDATSLNANNKSLVFTYEELDINKNAIAGRKFSTLLTRATYADGIYHFCINNFGFPYPPFSNQTYFIRYTLENANNSANVVATKIAERCNVNINSNNVQIVWRNNLGGLDYWNFKDYEIENKAEKAELFTTYAARNSRVYNKEASLRLKVFDVVSKEYIEGLASLANARLVWIEDAYNLFFKYRSLRQSQYIEIVADSETLKIYENANGMYSFELEFVLTKNNV